MTQRFNMVHPKLGYVHNGLASYIIHSCSILTTSVHCAQIRYISSTQNSLVVRAYSAHLAPFLIVTSLSSLTPTIALTFNPSLNQLTTFYPKPIHIYTLILGLIPLQNGPNGLTTTN
jgi:hypothetical protein